MRPSMWSGFGSDIRHALRGLASSPGFTFGVILSVGIGIAANTIAFTILNTVFLRDYRQVHKQEELVRVEARTGRAYIGTTHDEYLLLQSRISGLLDLAAEYRTQLLLSSGGEPATMEGSVVSGNYFTLAGVRPAAGRLFEPADDGEPWRRPVAVISFDLWRDRFGSDAAIAGRTISVNGADLAVVGVAPPEFYGLGRGASYTQIWIPLAMSELAMRTADGRPVNFRSYGQFAGMDYFGRRRSGVSIAQLQAQASTLLPAFAASPSRARYGDVNIHVTPMQRSTEDFLEAFSAFMSLPLLVLAIACANAANLFLARATQRGRDWILRLALGASRWRIVRQMLVECLIVAMAGCAGGLVLTYWGNRYIETEVPLQFVIDGTVIAFSIIASVVTALLFGAGPAIAVTRSAARGRIGANRRDTWFGSRTRAALVVVQAALSIALLSTGAQFTRTIHAAIGDDGIENADRFVVATLDVDKLRYTEPQARSFFNDAYEAAAAIPSVTHVSLTAGQPWGAWSGGGMYVWMPGRPSTEGTYELSLYAGGDLLGVLGLPVLEGRNFNETDRTGALRTVIVNKPFADRFPGGQALGRTFRVAASSALRPSKDPASYASGHDVVVVGVAGVPAVKRIDSLPAIFHPVPLRAHRKLELFLTTSGDGAAAAAVLRARIAALEPRLPLARISTLHALNTSRESPRAWIAFFVAALGGLALLLSAFGLFGVVSYMIMMRQREIGIRMALGAARRSVIALVLRQSLRPALIGCVVGAAGAVAAASIIRSRMYGASPFDPAATLGAAALVITTLLVATLVPARRAASVDPAITLRHE
ncbi:MAG TPA: ADOP family duplicated permease [Vicinamibacterales bacterium]